MSVARKDIEISAVKRPNRVIIDAESARRLRARIMGMRRAAINIKLNAATFVEEADAIIELFDLLKTETEQP